MNNQSRFPILFLNPVLKQMVWGGSRLHTDFGYEPEADNLGECWGIAAHSNGDSVLKNLEFSGMTLSKLWKEKPEFFGKYDTEQFPSKYIQTMHMRRKMKMERLEKWSAGILLTVQRMLYL